MELNKQTSLKEEEIIVKSIEEALLMSESRLRAALKNIYESGKAWIYGRLRQLKQGGLVCSRGGDRQ